ncbi:hypothetical protein [Streptomyces colonosanans]|uniref:Uncharacterized protein n=1 Tax=Streptomyces colonosanans TaxID=1428652 RepID=A0A1S2P4H5_9ACTN|nr:hypothetical protein [Streptomyces colonosanans]OIJ88402.1 hypothetical protein BIV24_22865 [Streptomyces colonosanans]
MLRRQLTVLQRSSPKPVHVSETCHPPSDGDRPTHPNLITNVTTTCSALPDGKALDTIHQVLRRRHLL